MNPVDVLLLVILVPFALRGWGRGFCRETLGLMGLVGGVLLAAAGGAPLAATLVARGLVSPFVARLLAPVVLFVGAVVAAHLVGGVADRLARAMLLGGVNRIAGLVFGALKGAALLGFALLLAQQVAPSAPLNDAVAGSRLASPLTRLAAGIVEAGRGFGGHPAGEQV